MKFGVYYDQLENTIYLGPIYEWGHCSGQVIAAGFEGRPMYAAVSKARFKTFIYLGGFY